MLPTSKLPIDVKGLTAEMQKELEDRVIEFEKDFEPSTSVGGEGYVPIIQKRDYIIAGIVNGIIALYYVVAVLFLYLDWCEQPKNIYADYTGFKKFLLTSVRLLLKEYSVDDAPDYSVISPGDYSEKYSSLMKHKETQNHNKYAPNLSNSVAIDVNNIMHINNVRKQSKKIYLKKTHISLPLIQSYVYGQTHLMIVVSQFAYYQAFGTH